MKLIRKNAKRRPSKKLNESSDVSLGELNEDNELVRNIMKMNKTWFEFLYCRHQLITFLQGTKYKN